MKIDKEKVILFTTKYVSYLINTVIVLAIGAFVTGWVYFLYKSGTG